MLVNKLGKYFMHDILYDISYSLLIVLVRLYP